MNIEEIDHLCVTSIVDNVADRSFSGVDDPNCVRRFRFRSEMYDAPLPIGEHGFCMLMEMKQDSTSSTLLVDAGVSEAGLRHNLEAMTIDPTIIDEVILTHGHVDHFKGLPVLGTQYGLRGLKIYSHPAVFAERKFRENDKGKEVYLPPLDRSVLNSLGFEVITTDNPQQISKGMVLASGRIKRLPQFSNPLPYHFTKEEGRWIEDPELLDDQCVIANVRGQGLVIITGCGHAGLINIIYQAQRLTGISNILAIFGGFHLYQNHNLQPVWDALAQVNPIYLIPTHCTGWRAIHEMSQRFPKAFIQNAVGTTYIFRSDESDV